MRKLKLFLSMLMLIAFSVGNVWADPAAVGTTLFSENFGSYSADDVPSGSVSAATGRVIYGGGSVTYTSTNGTGTKPGTTKIWNENTGGGTAPEILVGKQGTSGTPGSFKIAGIPSGGAQVITVSWTQNKQLLTGILEGTGYSTTYTFPKPTTTTATISFDITVADGADETFDLTLRASSSNVRVDDILITVKTAGEGGAPAKTLTSIAVSGTPTKTSYYVGDEFDPAGLVVTGTYSDNSQAPITSGITWAYDPSQELALNQTSIGVIATVSEIASPKVNVSITVTEAPAAVEYALFSGDIEEGDYVIYYDGKAMKNTIASNRFSYLSVAPANDKITNPDASIVWHIAQNNTYWTLYNESVNKYAGATGSNNQGKLVDANDATALWSISGSETYNIVNKSQSDNSKNAYLRNNGTYGFATYAQGTGGPLSLYKKVDDQVAVAKPTISGETPFLTSTTVSITHADADHIYYTTNGDAPTTSSAEYSAPFSLTNTATVKAIAVKGSDESAAAEKTFTKATVLSVSEARAAIDAGGDLTNKFVAGIISQIDSYQSNYHSITYWISDDGTTTNQLQVYSGLAGVVKSAFASKDDLAVGDDVTVKGTLKKYNSTYEFDYNNTIEAYKPIARLAWSAESFDAALEGENTFPSLTNTNGVTVSYSSSDPTKASFADASVYEITLNAAGSTTITATFAGNETYKANSASYTLNIASSLVTLTYNVDGGEAIDPANVSALPNPLPTTTKAGKNFGGWFTDPEKEVAAVPGAAISENTTLYAKWLDPYTVAEAKTVIDANPDGIANQYVAGIISQIDSYNNTYKSITYWISVDGTTENQLQVYSGKIGNAATALGKEDFSAKEDLELGDEVVVTGTLKLHNSTTYEFDKNNTIYTFSRKASAGLEYAVDAVEKTVGDADFVNELTNPNSVAVSYESSDEQVAEVANDGTVTIIGEGTATISATFAGNGTYKAAVVSYTLTVSATVETRHIANSPATFTTTNGNLDPADIAYASYQGGASTAPAIYNDGIRLYQISGTNDFGGFVTITAKTGCTIDEVQITTTSKYATTVAYSVDGNETLSGSESVAKSGSYTTGTGLNVSSVNILNLGTGSDGRLEIASIKVYYTGEAATIDHYELGGTYQTAFMQDEDFNHTGLIVYAVYDALGENKVDITSMCTFSEPDMSTTGEKTIEITYNEAVVASYTINVAADSRKVADSPATFTTVSGDMTPNDITFASYQGGAGTAPANYNDGIRLYQAPSSDAIGGFITLKAKKGCTIDQVKITTTNTYATTVAYSVDGNENLLGSESVAKSSDYSTPSGLNVESVNIVNKGTGSSGRLEIASIKVWYTGDPLAVDHYFLGGTYETTFEQNGTFDYTGLEVYASYDAGETITEPVEGFTVQADLSTAGDKKAEVYLNEVKIAEYDITVTAGKENPALAYNPASATITAGDAWSAPTLSNTFNVSPITYSSDKESVASVDENGVITLAGGYGTAVITAHFDETAEYIESEATYTITVNKPAPTPTSTVYRKVTATADITDGEYLIVYEGNVDHDAAVFDGSLDNVDQAMKVLAVEIENDEIAGNTELDAAVFTIDVTAGSLQSASGLYIGRTANSNGMDKSTTEAYVNTFAITDGAAVITSAEGPTLRYNYASDQLRFRYYKSGQQAIQLYKKVVVEPEWENIRAEEVAPNAYYTMCLDKAVTAVQGASIWKVISKAQNDKDVILEEVTTTEAGRPYIFFATVANPQVQFTGNPVNGPVNDAENHGLVGSFSQVKITADASNYIIYNNALYYVNTDNVYVGAHRAYLNMDAVPDYQNGSAPAPGRRRVNMSVYGEQTATGMDALNATDAPVKMMINGQLFILRGEKMYDATGRLVK